MSFSGMMQTKSGRPVHPIGIGTLGLGTYPLFSPGTRMEIEAIQYAISLGQNHIDTAEMYAKNGAEQLVGWAIEPTDRHDLFIASKLWKAHVAAGTVRAAVEGMLSRLNTSYLDVLYIHVPWPDVPWHEALPQIGELIDEGVVRYLGVSNFDADCLREALAKTSYPITTNQVQYSCTHQEAVPPELRQLHEANEISVVAYTPLDRGKALSHPAVRETADEHGGTPAQVMLAWLLAHQATPIPKATSKAHIRQNASAHTIALPAAAVARLDELGRDPVL